MADPSSMRAVLFFGPGDLRLVQVPVPRPIGPGEIVVKIHAALTCGTDFKAYRQGHPILLKGDKALPFGHEMAGIVSELGPGVTSLAVGQRVVVLNSAPCNRCYFCAQGSTELCDYLTLLNGAYAEYIRVPSHIAEQNVHPLPDAMGFAEAALTEPLACALHAVDKLGVKPGETIALIGAGNMARFLVCALKRADARVIVLGRDAGRLSLASAAGADETINITVEPDGTAALRSRTDQKRGADGVIEAVGKPETWALSIGMARKGGRVCLFGGCASGAKAEIDAHRVHYHEVTVFGVFHHRPSYVRQALDLLGSGAIKPELFIDRELSLDEVIPFFAANANTSTLKAAVIM